MFNQLLFNEEKGQYNIAYRYLVKTNGGKKNKALASHLLVNNYAY
jgi:hypothetical protein